MAIEVACTCGKRLRVSDEQAGRKVRCPVCQDMVRVPGEKAEEPDAGYAVETVRKCPSCRAEWTEDAVVCIRCGYNFRTGKKMETVYDIIQRTIVVGVRWLGSYTRLTIFRGRKGETSLTVARKFLFVPLGTRVLDLRDYDTIWTDCTLGDAEDNAPDVYYLELEGRKKGPVRILKTSDEWSMREVVDTLKEAARLQVKRK